ncbi:MAG: sensor histidine kinase [Streptosporangiaceae bacterium]
MRQPVAAVLALAVMALADPDVGEETRALLEQIITQTEWLADIIGQWLDTADPPAPRSRVTNLTRVVNEAAAAERLTWHGELTVAWPAEPVYSPVSRVNFRRMVANLLGNAIRAAGPSGRVSIKIERRDGHALIVIEDSGPGFGPVQEGFGLGLSSVARSVVACRGRLECVHGPRRGARVHLWLPLTNDLRRRSVGSCA